MTFYIKKSAQKSFDINLPFGTYEKVISEKQIVSKKEDVTEKVCDFKQYHYDLYYLQSRFTTLLGCDKKRNTNFSRLSNDTLAWAATQFQHPTLKEDAYQLLFNSTLLSVWDVKAEIFNSERYVYEEEANASYYLNKPVYSVIMGLARHNQTGKLFHWVTDLGRDIDVLFSLEPSQSLLVDSSTQTDFGGDCLHPINKKRKRDELN